MLFSRLVAFALGLTLGVGCGGQAAGPVPVDASDGPTIDAAAERLDGSSRNESGADAAASCNISASSYDQSCKADTDCTLVDSRNYCEPGCVCPNSTVNVGALAQYNADVATTPLGSGALGSTACPCRVVLPPCCRDGRCVLDCSSPSDTLPACADAGGVCVYGMQSCNVVGPPGSCAFADELCCGG
jgi:hypothetical protein